MPTPTYTPLATLTLASSTSSITFSNIPSTYRDLILVASGMTASGTGAMGVGARFNSDSSSSYSNQFMFGDGTSIGAGSGSGTGADIGRFDNSQGDFIVQFIEYSATDKHKSILSRYNNSIAVTVGRAFRWANTSAITSMNLYNASGNGEIFGAGCTFSLYGIVS